jgi:hypothetical protein
VIEVKDKDKDKDKDKNKEFITNPFLCNYLDAYFAYFLQIKIQEELGDIPVPRHTPIEDGNIMVFWDKKDKESCEKWDIVSSNRHHEEKLYKTDVYPGISLIIGKNSRIEIDSSAVCTYRPMLLSSKKVITLSKKVIDKLYKSGMIKLHPELLRLVPFEGNNRRDKTKNIKSSDKTSDKTSKNKKGEKSKASNEDQETEVVGLESMDD